MKQYIHIIKAVLLNTLICISVIGFSLPQVYCSVISESCPSPDDEDSKWLSCIPVEGHEFLKKKSKPIVFLNGGYSKLPESGPFSPKKGTIFLHLFLLYCSLRIAVY